LFWEQSREERFPKPLFAFSWCMIVKMMVPETCLTVAGARKRLGWSLGDGGAAAGRGKILFLLL
jgi:hypothetical protein